MPGRVRITATSAIRFDRTAAIIASVRSKLTDTVNDSASNIQTISSQIAPVDTGALRESIYVTNGTDSDYNSRVARARSLKPTVQIVEEVDPEFVISPSAGGALSRDSYIVVVGVAAGHGVPQEFGTRFIRAQPYLRPAAIGEEGNFTEAMSHLTD